MNPIQHETRWAAVTPPNRRTGQRWICDWTISRLKKWSINKLLGEALTEDERIAEWRAHRRQGWTIERVFVAPVLNIAHQPRAE